jgi:hypothetical protein
MKTEVCRVPYQVPLYPDVIRAHLLIGWPYGGILKQSPQMLCQKFWDYFFHDFPESGLGIRCIPNPSELASSVAGLDGPTNGWPHTHWSDLYPLEDFPCRSDLPSEGLQVESALHSMSLGIQGVNRQRKGGGIRGSHNRTMYRAIPREKISEEDRGNRHEGEFGSLCLLCLSCWRRSAGTLGKSNF